MKQLFLLIFLFVNFSCNAQSSNGIESAAEKFLQTLSPDQKAKAQFSFDQQERYNWHFIPKEDRKGITLNELNTGQRNAALQLLHTSLSDTGYNKTISIMQLDAVLKELENRGPDDHYRDPGKYYFSIFGEPSSNKIWGWRLEGHHISFNFCSENNRLVSGTPGFLGANPAVVLSGPEKGKQILKDETELAFALLHLLDADQLKKSIISIDAPAEIITGASRSAMISDPKGILYSELTSEQQKALMQLLSIYIHRYTRLFAMDMMHEIEEAGIKNLRFAWAGASEPGLGHPHYYRIQGPTIIIEYDNTQNNANHVHTVVRDLKHDFGGDELLQHYKNQH
jgi:Protein of unknown function (DUF3500)